jgi:hypothetical protein
MYNCTERIPEYFTKRGVHTSHSVIGLGEINNYKICPFLNKLQQLQWTFLTIEEELRNELKKVPLLKETELCSLSLPEYMPTVNPKAYAEELQEARTRSTIIVRTYNELCKYQETWGSPLNP